MRPDLVFTHPPSDYMLDHEMTSMVTCARPVLRLRPNYDTGRRPFAEPTEHFRTSTLRLARQWNQPLSASRPSSL
ncbi:MAG: hypothetical protein R2724_30425 [Bryobacterales bacterium]